MSHVKISVEIADSLLAEAKQVAAQENVALRDLIEEGLRRRARAPANGCRLLWRLTKGCPATRNPQPATAFS